MPPLIRRAPLSERIKALLNPYDLWLWVSEELHESALDEKFKEWTVPIGFGLNFVYMIARANSANQNRSRSDDVFGDFEGKGGSGWFALFATLTAQFLAGLSILNALYLFTRTRKYRLFESNVEVPPTTPSARRVKVDSSPMSNSPLSYFSAKFAPSTAASRAYPDEKTDVWELSIWDPKPLHLSLFALFSPGHVLVYWIFLPTSALDPRPSVTVVTTILLAGLLTAQLLLFKVFFEQKAKDDKVLHKEVMNEYDTKYVHPSLNRPSRDVGIQTISSATSPRGTRTREVDIYTPKTIVNRGFKINPNPSYAAHLGDNIDTEKLYTETPARRISRNATSLLNLQSPTPNPPASNTYASMGAQTYGAEGLSPPKPLPRQVSQPSLQPQQRDRTSGFPRTGGGDGGSLGVFSHAASPLRKSSGRNILRPQKSGEFERGGSPLKKVSVPAAPNFGTNTSARSMQREERHREDERVERERGARLSMPYGGAGAGGRMNERYDSRESSGDDGLRQRLAGLRDGAAGAGTATPNRRQTGRY